MSRRPTLNLLFELGAEVYGWFTAQAAWRASCAELARRLPTEPGPRVVDLGCGPGVSTFELARLRPDARVMGLDVAQRMLAEARRRAKRQDAQRRIAWVRGDAARLPLATNGVDALTGHSFLYLLADRKNSLAEMWRVLRPGGRVVLMEPNARAASPRQVLSVGLDPRSILALSLWRPYSRFHGRFTTDTLRQTLEDAGFVHCETVEVLNGLGVLAHAEKPPG